MFKGRVIVKTRLNETGEIPFLTNGSLWILLLRHPNYQIKVANEHPSYKAIRATARIGYYLFE